MPTLVEQTALGLAQLSLDSDGGSFLGSEEALLARFRVSRPTLRQAAKMVANDRLIDIRRGSGGGFYAARPDADDAVRTLARFLRLKGASLHDVMVVSRPIAEEAAALAAQGDDPALRAELAAYVQRNQADSPGAIIRAETELARLLAALSGNPVIELVMAIGYTFGLDERGSRLFADPDRRQRARELQRAVAEAVLAGDGDVARLMMRRRGDQFAAWLSR
jgi:DNA-binding FadR family transcriptional regulator